MQPGRRLASVCAITVTMTLTAPAAARAQPCPRSTTAWPRTCSPPTRPTGSPARCGSRRASTATATASSTACTSNFTLPKETQTNGLNVPVVYEDSPYFAGTGAASNWLVDHELGAQPPTRGPQAFFTGFDTSPDISNDYESDWLPRGFGVVHSESPGTGHSDGCPSSGGPNETLGATAVIDWLNGRRRAFTTRTGNVAAPPSTGTTARRR